MGRGAERIAPDWAGSQIGRRAGGSGHFLGFPLEGFGFLTSLLLAVSSGVLAFSVATGLAIFALLIWNLGLHHNVNFAFSYLYVGLPTALVVLTIAFGVFGTLWVKAKFRSANRKY
jgi:hypothetical protein